MSEVIKTKRVWIAWTNSDTTEGRGQAYPYCISESRATAIRVGDRAGVMGSDCDVRLFDSPLIDGKWLVPGFFTNPTMDDQSQDLKYHKFQEAVLKAKASGLDDETIKTLTKT